MIRTTVETITPQIAERWLTCNHNNRPLKRTLVEKYKLDMQEGRWTVATDIDFDSNGRLINGQHRLTACVEAGVPFTSKVTRGLDPHAFTVMDRGVRTEAEVAGIAGVKNATKILSTLNKALSMEASQGMLSSNRNALKLVSVERKLEMIEKHPRIVESTLMAYRAYENCPALVASIIGGLHYLVGDTMRAKADDFVERLGTGEGLRIGDPIHTLRQRYIDRASRARKEGTDYMAVITIYAWNAHAQGRTLKKILWRQGDDKVPTIIR